MRRWRHPPMLISDARLASRGHTAIAADRYDKAFKKQSRCATFIIWFWKPDRRTQGLAYGNEAVGVHAELDEHQGRVVLSTGSVASRAWLRLFDQLLTYLASRLGFRVYRRK